MSRIRILSDHLANQIAAGEVVERPASVVKELLENSLDAGSSRVTVQVEGGGTRLLRVMDNGMGMDEDDVLLSLERHATSKLMEESQLTALSTLGFRGEAIPSIGSVSRLTILSRPPERSTGTRAEVRYGTLHAVHEDGCARGTIVEVNNLFGNIPARKKFLKTNRTEIFHIEEVIKNQALAYPDVSFFLQVDGRQSIQYPVADNLEERVRAVFRYQGRLIELKKQGDSSHLSKLSGFLLLPESGGSKSSRLRLLVNGRPVQDRMIRHAVVEGLQGFLMKGYSPAGALVLHVVPDEVDVNVHPAKREIRFRHSREVHQSILEVVRQSIQRYQEQVRAELFTTPSAAVADVNGVSLPPSLPDRAYRPTSSPAPSLSSSEKSPSLLRSFVSESREPEVDEVPAEILSVPANPTSEQTGTTPAETTGLNLIGQLMDLYLLCEKNGHLLVIDQHAAHERILYGRLRQAYMNLDVPAQNLLFPVTVELAVDHCELLEQQVDVIEQFGLKVEHFGEATWVIKAVPAVISAVAPAEILIESLEALRNSTSNSEGTIPDAVDQMFASMACKAAIKAGNRLRPEEMLELLLQMEKSDIFSHCPHGRPVIKTFSQVEIERWFHRS